MPLLRGTGRLIVVGIPQSSFSSCSALMTGACGAGAKASALNGDDEREDGGRFPYPLSRAFDGDCERALALWSGAGDDEIDEALA